MVKINNDLIENCHDYNIIIDSREIFLYTEAEDGMIDCNMAMNFIKNLKILEKSIDTIIIHQYSTGGDWSAGMAIYDAIKNSPCKFIFICYGVACSMGSIIPQAVCGKGYRITHKNCDWLIHEGDLYVEGTPIKTKSNLDYLEINKATMYDIYTNSCINGVFFETYNKSKTKAYIKRKITEKTDWCLTSEEAVKFGFADGIFGEADYIDIKTIKGYL